MLDVTVVGFAEEETADVLDEKVELEAGDELPEVFAEEVCEELAGLEELWDEVKPALELELPRLEIEEVVACELDGVLDVPLAECALVLTAEDDAEWEPVDAGDVEDAEVA